MNEAIAITLFGSGMFFLITGLTVIASDPVRDTEKGLCYSVVGFVILIFCFITVFFKVM